MRALVGVKSRTTLRLVVSTLALLAAAASAFAQEEDDMIDLSEGLPTSTPSDAASSSGGSSSTGSSGSSSTTAGARTAYRSHAKWISEYLKANPSAVKDSKITISSIAGLTGSVEVSCKKPGEEVSCFGNQTTCAETKLAMIEGFADDMENRSKRFQVDGLPIEVDDGDGLTATSSKGSKPIVPWYANYSGGVGQLGSNSRISSTSPLATAAFLKFASDAGGAAKIVGGRSDEGELSKFFGGSKKPGVVVKVSEGYGKMEQALISGAKQIALDYASSQVINEVLKGNLKLSNLCSRHIGLLQANKNQFDSLANAIPPQYCSSPRHNTQIELLKTAIIEQLAKAAPSKVLVCETLVRYWQYHRKMFAEAAAFKEFRDAVANEISTGSNQNELRRECRGKLSRRKAGECLAKCMSGGKSGNFSLYELGAMTSLSSIGIPLVGGTTFRSGNCPFIYGNSFISQYQNRIVKVVGSTFWESSSSPAAIVKDTWSTGGVSPDPYLDSNGNSSP